MKKIKVILLVIFTVILLLEVSGWGIKHNIYNFNNNLVRSARKIRDSNYNIIFDCYKTNVDYNSYGVSGLNSGCIHVIETYSDCAVDYVTKESNYKNDNIKFLGIDGLSDSIAFRIF